MTNCRKTVLTCLLLSCLGPATARELLVDPQVTAMFANVPIRDMMSTFATIIDAELDFDLSLTGEVAISVKKVLWSEAITQVCRDFSCRWEVLDGETRILRVTKIEKVAAEEQNFPMTELISLELENTRLSSVLELLAYSLEADLVNRATDVDLSLHFDSVPIAVILDLTCAAKSCRWAVIDGSLVVEPGPAGERSQGFGTSRRWVEAKSIAEEISSEISRASGRRVDLLFEIPDRLIEVDPSWTDWAEALEELCAGADCGWKLRSGRSARLELQVY